MAKDKTSKSKTEEKSVQVDQPKLKKSTSSYMLFCAEERPVVKKELPDLNNKEIVSELGRRWSLLSTSDPKRKEKLDKVAKADQERYKREKEELLNSGSSTTSSNSSKKVVEEEKPKKKRSSKKKEEVVEVAEVVEEEKPQKKTVINGYLNYSKQHRAQVKKDNPDLSPQDVSRELGKLWKALSVEEKETYKY